MLNSKRPHINYILLALYLADRGKSLASVAVLTHVFKAKRWHSIVFDIIFVVVVGGVGGNVIDELWRHERGCHINTKCSDDNRRARRRSRCRAMTIKKPKKQPKMISFCSSTHVLRALLQLFLVLSLSTRFADGTALSFPEFDGNELSSGAYMKIDESRFKRQAPGTLLGVTVELWMKLEDWYVELFVGFVELLSRIFLFCIADRRRTGTIVPRCWRDHSLRTVAPIWTAIRTTCSG